MSPLPKRHVWHAIFQVRNKSRGEEQQRTDTWNPKTPEEAVYYTNFTWVGALRLS